jgi:OmpA-OmpF porin, OOP family
MRTTFTPVARALALALAIGSFSFAGSVSADDVKSLRGKPTSGQILEALSPSRSSSGFRTRGLSLGNSEAAKADAPAAKQQVAAEPETRALDLDIKFEFNSGKLNQDGQDVLDQLAEALKSDALSGAKSIVLEGHADAKGNPAYNKVLSLQRAQSARSYLATKHGIPSKKVKAVGKGSSEPVDPGNPEDEVNRRVRVIING